MNYWIDGYNLFFRITKSYHEMRANERKLLQALNRSLKLLRGSVTVVFDGREKDPPEALRKNLDALALIYTPTHQTADDYIVEAIDSSRNPSNETVVSSDRELLQKVKLRGANTLTIERFLSDLVKKKSKKKHDSMKHVQESDYQLQRLLKIFEEKLKDEGDS